MSGGVKYDGGKIRYDLLPPELLDGVARVLTYGAQKYTVEHTIPLTAAVSWLEKKLEPDAIQFSLRMREGSVGRAMNATYGSQIQSTPRGSERITAAGVKEIPIGSKPPQREDALTPCVESEMQRLSGAASYVSGDSMDTSSPSSHYFSAGAATYVAEVSLLSAPSISTMTTRLEPPAVSFVVDATTASECLRKALTGCFERSPIFKARRLRLLGLSDQEMRVEETGARNWELGIEYGRVFGAIMRHMWAWWRGEVLDKDTGMSHLWHAGCELAFLIAFEDRKRTDLDDRPRVKQTRDDVHTQRAPASPGEAVSGEDGQSLSKGDSGCVVFGSAPGPVDRVQVRPPAATGYHRNHAGTLSASAKVDTGEIA